MEYNGLLTSVVFLPLAGALFILLLAKGERNVRLFAYGITLVDLILAVWVFCIFDHHDSINRFQLIDKFAWIGPDAIFENDTFKASYHLGIDGLSTPLVLLTGILGFCATLASRSIQVRVKEYFVWLLVLQTAVMGVFTSLDFLLFFLFWELELIPMYMLISVWGTGRKEYSAMKFLIFTILGSAFMLVAIIAVYIMADIGTFNMLELTSHGLPGQTSLIPVSLIFWLFFAAFAIKLPVWPVHTWLPDAHTDAPTAVSVMLAGVLLKMGGYGLIRVCVGMFSGMNYANIFSHILLVLAVVGILYGAIVTLRQTDLKRLIAYSSISHMGLVLLGVAIAIGGSSSSELVLVGASMQMFAHGTITGLMFMVVGAIYDRAHTRYIPDLGGLATNMPFLSCAFIVGGLASLGLPGLSGFVAEILVFLGSFAAFPWHTALAASGIILAAAYILWMIQRVLFGPARERFSDLRDASLYEIVPISILVISIVIVGVYPEIITGVFEAGIKPIAYSLSVIGT